MKEAVAMRNSSWRRRLFPGQIASWWRGAAPPAKGIACWLLVYSFFFLLPVTVLPTERMGPMWPQLFDGFILGTAAAFGIFRALRWHPAFRAEYLPWLAATPWKPGMPLPLGPVLLTTADAVLVALLAAAGSLNPAAPAVRVPVAFLEGYLGAFGCIFLATREKPAGFLLLYGIGAAALVGGWPGLAIAGALYACAAWRVPQSLALQLQSDSVFASLQRMVLSQPPTRALEEAGWPTEYLSPKRRYPSISFAAGVGGAGLAAFWWYVFAMRAGLRASVEEHEFYLVAWGSVVVVAIFRLLVYGALHQAPTSLLGRIASGHWIVPRYDWIFLAPIAAFLAPLGVFLIGDYVRASPEIGSAAALFAGVACALLLGPRLETFALAGSHALRPPRPSGIQTASPLTDGNE